MGWSIPGGIGATGYSDTDDMLKRLDALKESQASSREEAVLMEAARVRKAARMAEIRDLLRPTD